MSYELRYHNAMPGWCKIIGLQIKAIHVCEGGGFAIAQPQAEIIVAALNDALTDVPREVPAEPARNKTSEKLS